MNCLTTALTVILTLILVTSQTNGCFCPQRTYERQICESDFTIRVMINSLQTYLEYSNASYYKIRVLTKPYKLNEKAEYALSRNRLFTHKDSGDCGRTFARGRMYVVSGTVDQYHNAWTSMCDYSQLYDIVNREEKSFLRNRLLNFDCNNIIFNEIYANNSTSSTNTTDDSADESTDDFVDSLDREDKVSID